MYGYFMQDNATANKANFSVIAQGELFGEWLITDRWWPPR
jgi:hypothetical protein